MHRLVLVFSLALAVAVGVAVGTVLDGRSAHAAATTAAKKCSKASLSGAYGVKFDGTSKSLGRFASVSLWRFDGKGKLKASESFNSEQTGPDARAIAGRYTIKRNCTFRLFFPSELAKSHEAVGRCVLVAGRREFHCLDFEEGWQTIGSGTRVR